MVVRKNKRYTLVGSLQFGQGIPQGARERLRNDFPGARGAGYVMAVWHSCPSQFRSVLVVPRRAYVCLTTQEAVSLHKKQVMIKISLRPL